MGFTGSVIRSVGRFRGLLALALGAACLTGAPCRASADFGALAAAFVLPEAVVERVDTSDDRHLGWTLRLAPTLSREVGASLSDDLGLLGGDTGRQVGNVVGLLGRGFDLGKVGEDDALLQDRLLLQVRTSFGGRRLLLRCVVRFP